MAICQEDSVSLSVSRQQLVGGPHKILMRQRSLNTGQVQRTRTPAMIAPAKEAFPALSPLLPAIIEMRLSV